MEIVDHNMCPSVTMPGAYVTAPNGWFAVLTQGPINENDQYFEICPDHRDDFVKKMMKDRRYLSVQVINVPKKDLAIVATDGSDHYFHGVK